MTAADGPLSVGVAPVRYEARQPAGRGRLAVAERAGLRVVVRGPRGQTGMGEALPYPGLSLETLDDVARAAAEVTALPPFVHEGSFRATCARALAPFVELLAPVPSLQFALESAIAQIVARARGTDVASVIADGAPAQAIDVSALLGDVAAPDVVARGRAAIASGYGTVKVKAGAGDLASLRALRAALADEAPGARVRVDFNGAMTPGAWAEVAGALRALEIEVVEDPVPPDQMRSLAGHGPPVLWDERCAAASDWIETSSTVAGVVLKPTLLGLSQASGLARRLAAAGKKVVVTHAFEGPAALAMVRAFAFAVSPCGLAHGVDAHPFATSGEVMSGPRLVRTGRPLAPVTERLPDEGHW